MIENPVISAKLIDEPLKIFNSMLEDIENAKKSIFLETYKYENGPIGKLFREKLTLKAKEGLKVKLLIDDWESSVSEHFFSELIKFGGEVKFFKKLRLSINFFSVNHERDHRKLLIIDDNITYISSLNITNYCMAWRETSLRIPGKITRLFKVVFNSNYNLKNTYKFNKKRYTRTVKFADFQIIRDVPSVVFQRHRKKFLHLINQAKREIIIETPYFLPTRLLRDALQDAAKRGVQVKIFMPKHSDIKMIDILKDLYLGKLYEAGVEIFFYQPKNLHSKILTFDNTWYFGTCNFDYRSFRYQFETGLIGTNCDILNQIKLYNQQTLENSKPFDYEKWNKRSFIQKIIERILVPLRHFL